MAYVGFRNERVMAKATETLKPHLVGHHIYIYIYIYLYRKRERERERETVGDGDEEEKYSDMKTGLTS
jgi:hypothetical protein